jgi:hypothetical protein
VPHHHPPHSTTHSTTSLHTPPHPASLPPLNRKLTSHPPTSCPTLHRHATNVSSAQGWLHHFLPFSLRLPVSHPQPAHPGRHVIILAASLNSAASSDEAIGSFINRIDISSVGQAAASPLISPGITNYQAAGDQHFSFDAATASNYGTRLTSVLQYLLPSRRLCRCQVQCFCGLALKLAEATMIVTCCGMTALAAAAAGTSSAASCLPPTHSSCPLPGSTAAAAPYHHSCP